MKHISSLRRFAAVCAVLFLMLSFSVSAESPNPSFTYDLENKSMAAPEAAQWITDITGEGMGTARLSEPTDVCSDNSGNLYIVDKGNSRILKTDSNGKLLAVVDSFDNGGTAEHFSSPEGICVTADGDIYICDTMNERVVHLSSSMELKRIISAPERNVLSDDFVFTPIRIAVDGLNRIYIVSRNFNSGILELNKKGEFNQIFGAVKTQYTVAEIFWRAISTKAQRERSAALIPNEYSSVCADDKNFLYACSAYFDSTSGSRETVKKLNALGTNILGDVPDPYINMYSKGTYRGAETYTDIIPIGSGIYALLDNTRGRVYAYNDDGDMLFEFGGKGDYVSTLGSAAAFSYYNGTFYIADSKNDRIAVFGLTDYAMLYIKAAEYHALGDYSAENEVWKSIYKLNNNSVCTIRSFGKVNLREKNYKAAMEYFRQANDRESYSEAFSAQRKIFMNEHFTLIFIGAIAAVILLIAFLVWRSRHPKVTENKFTYRATLGYAKKVIFRPLSGFWDMKKEHYGSTSAALTVLAAATLFYALFNSLKGYIFGSGTQGAGFLPSLLTVIIPFFLFVICNWCVSSLMSGEGSFKYIFMGTAYSLTPLILLLPVLLLLSHIMTADEKGIYSLILSVALLWTLLLVVCSNMQVHSYTMGKTVLVLIITVVIMVAVVFLAALVFALLQEIIGVAGDMINELYLRR